ncbi:1-acyl-sn-glycerol-3-phosphate acyltransferase [Chlamydia trachomatis]|nr:1-acyl-sn-glycerol-3-phosphate acyltransferase [Chlamydia trachomatis]
MKRNFKRNLSIIILVFALALYHVLPTCLYYSRPLNRKIDGREARKIIERFTRQVSDARNDLTLRVAKILSTLKLRGDIKQHPSIPGVVNVHFPLAEDAGNAAAFKAALNIFSHGGRLIIYPEGTRHADGEIHQGKVGVGMLAIKGNVPVIPVYVAGTFEAFGKNQKFPKLWRTLTTVIGSPISFQDLIDNPAIDKKEAYQLATDRIMTKITELRTWFQQGCIGEIP